MGELYYRGDDSPKWDEKRGVYSGRVWHTEKGVDGKKRRYWKRYTCEAKGKRAATTEYKIWRSEIEARAQSDLKRGANAVSLGESLVSDYVSQFIDMRESTKANEASTIKDYRTSLKRINERFAHTAMKDVKPSDVESWMAALTNRGLSSSSVRKAYRLLKMVMDDAINHGVVDQNPLDTVKPPKLVNKNKGKNAIDMRGRAELLDKLDAMELCPASVAAYISLYTGLREGEVCALQWRDLDISNRVLWVRRALGSGKGGAYVKQPKTDKPRDVALPASLVDVLRRWKALQRKSFADKMSTFREDSYIIGDPLGFYQPNRLSREWRTLAQLFDIRGVEGRRATFHDLRHTWATMYLASGGDSLTAASNLGHKKPSMTLDVYASADPDAKKRSAAIVEKAMRDNGGQEL